MTTKMLLPNQCALLHPIYGQDDCCLCKANQRIAELETAIKQAKAEVAREILEVYDRYIKVLGEEIDTLSPLAISHGWRSVRTEAGNKCRADIQEVKSKYGGQK